MATQVDDASYRVVSEFRFWPRLLLIGSILIFLVVNAFFFINFDTYFAHGRPLNFLNLFLIILNPFVFGPLVRQLYDRAYKIIINNDTITRICYFGLGFKKNYKITDIIAFATYTLSSRKNANEYLYLILDNKKTIRVSSLYYRNYYRLKEEIVKHQIENRGDEHWSIWKHFDTYSSDTD